MLKELMDQILPMIEKLIPTMANFLKFIEIIIWPVVVLILSFKLREPIKSLLPFIDNIKYKGVEVKLKTELNTIKEDAAEAGIETKSTVSENTDIYKLIEISPSLAIIESWKQLEETARNKVEEIAPKNSKFKDINRRAISYLEYTGALTPQTAKAIRELNTLRNKVSHSSKIEISKEDAIEYSSLANAISKQVELIQELPKFKLVHLTRIIAELNSLIDSGKYNHIKIADIHPIIEEKE